MIPGARALVICMFGIVALASGISVLFRSTRSRALDTVRDDTGGITLRHWSVVAGDTVIILHDEVSDSRVFYYRGALVVLPDNRKQAALVEEYQELLKNQ